MCFLVALASQCTDKLWHDENHGKKVKYSKLYYYKDDCNHLVIAPSKAFLNKILIFWVEFFLLTFFSKKKKKVFLLHAENLINIFIPSTSENQVLLISRWMTGCTEITVRSTYASDNSVATGVIRPKQALQRQHSEMSVLILSIPAMHLNCVG